MVSQPGWVYCESSRLQKALLDAATSSFGSGQPVKIELGKQVDSVDAETGKICLSSGENFQGDIIIGADGINVTFSMHHYGC